jgi:phosphoenolpyruvate carboxykinase (GTP)
VGLGLEESKRPKVFQVNWFRKDSDGKFLWPGFGENSRVIEWIANRIEGLVDAVDSPIGKLPIKKEFNLDGLKISEKQFNQIFEVNPESWAVEAEMTHKYFKNFDGNIPTELHDQLWELTNRLAKI